MLLSRLPLPAGVMVLCLGLFMAHPASAQTDSKSAPSPVAPGDLSKPVFNTTAPVYDSVASLDKAAKTVVAEVEGRPITLGDVGDAIRALPAAAAELPFDALYPQVLEQLIGQAALVIRAQQDGVDEDLAVHRRVAAAADRQLAEEYLRRELSKGITEDALLERYNKDIAGRPGPEEVHVRVILADSEKAAAALLGEIQGGADFGAVAKRASKDTTAAVGGDLGFRTREQLTPQVGAVAFELSPGQVAPYPVQAAAGWFIVKVEERRLRPAPPFASVREQLRQSLLQERVIPFTAAALTKLKVRRYNFLGQEIDAEKPTSQ
ncbi:MAG: peptidylprolyl isomerase [Acetobacteraceae bacterium]